MNGLNTSTISVLINILASTVGLDEAEAQLATFGETASKAGSIATTALTAAGIAVAAVSAYSIKAASDFQSQMLLIQTQAGASAKEMQNMSQAVLQLAPIVGQTPKALAEGLYYIESAGLRGAQALDVLKMSAEGAAVGHEDLADVAKALTSVINSNIKGVQDYSQAMGTLDAIVGHGKMTMSDITGALSTGILPAAKAAGISLQQLGAAFDVFTNNGVPAQDAASRLRMSIGLMVAPSAAATKAMESIGLQSNTLAKDMQQGGLIQAVQDLHDKLQNLSQIQQEQVIGKMFGTREGATMLTLIQNVKTFGSDLEGVTSSSNKFASSWAAAQDQASFANQRLLVSLQTLAIQYGQVLLPAYTAIVNATATNLVPAINSLSGAWKIVTAAVQVAFIPVLNQLQVLWKEHHQSITLIAEALGGILLAAITGTIILLGALIQVVIKVVDAILTFGETVTKVFTDAWDVFTKTGSVFQTMGTVILDVFESVGNAFKSWINDIINGINVIIQGVDAIGKTKFGGGISIPTIPHFATGVTNFAGGFAMVGENGPELAYLPQGSNVYSNSETRQIMNSENGVTIINNNTFNTPTAPQQLLANINYNLATIRG